MYGKNFMQFKTKTLSFIVFYVVRQRAVRNLKNLYFSARTYYYMPKTDTENIHCARPCCVKKACRQTAPASLLLLIQFV